MFGRKFKAAALSAAALYTLNQFQFRLSFFGSSKFRKTVENLYLELQRCRFDIVKVYEWTFLEETVEYWAIEFLKNCSLLILFEDHRQLANCSHRFQLLERTLLIR